MLTQLIDACLRYRPVVLLVTMVLVTAGVVNLGRLPIDAFPDTTPVQVQVNATAPSLSPLEVERRLSFPLEQAISGMPGLTQVRSVSKFGFSQITATFDDDTELRVARQLVGERLAGVELPPDVDGPTLGPISTGLGEVFQYVVESEDLSPQELRTLHHWVIRPQLIQVAGVAEINTWGGFEKQYHVIVDPGRLVEYDLTLDELAAALADGNRNAGGGSMNAGDEALPIQGRGLAADASALESIVVTVADGIPVRLRQIATVREGHAQRRGAATAAGRGEVVLGLGFMLYGENSRELTHRLESRLAEVQGSLPQGVTVTPVYSRSKLVDAVLATVRSNLLEGALLVVALLFVFLGDLRAGLIVALAIPLSMLFAVNGMVRFGIAGSLMSLGAIDFGLLVDSSVIVVENAARRIDEDTRGRSIRELVRDAAVEVRKPTLLGELVIAVVYLPILTLEGLEGKLFRPMAITVILALAGSMLVSIALVPVLASYLVGRRRRPRGGRLLGLLTRGYRPLLELALARPRLTLTLAASIVVAGCLPLSRLGAEFVPRLDEQAIAINTIRMAGVSLDESVRYGTRIEQKLLAAFPDEIEHVWTRTGTAEVVTDPMGLEVSDVFVSLKERDGWTRATTQAELVQAMDRELEGMPGMRAVFTQPIEMRMSEMTAGIRADVGIKLFGDDLAVLQSKGEELRLAVAAIRGAEDVTLEQISGQPMLIVEVDREAAGRHGIPAGEIMEVVESLGGRRVGEVVELDQRYFDVVLRLDEATRASPDRIAGLLIHTSAGERIPLAAVADIRVESGASTIAHEWARRRIVVQANVRGRDLGSFVAEVEEVLADRVELPDGYFVTLGGKYEDLERARLRLLFVIPIALLLVLALLYLTYGRLVDTLRVFMGVPFAAAGGVVALWLRDMPFSISAGIGFVALCGISLLGDMVLVSRVRALAEQGRDGMAAIREAAESRLRPVLITGSVAALGFVPMALAEGVGAEIQRPLATVVVGGVVTSTIATLFVLPVLYALSRRIATTSRAPPRGRKE